MSVFTYDVGYTENRNRLTVAFRIILAIPHIIVAGLWTAFIEILSVVQWFIILFTGKRNESIWGLQRSWIFYYSRVTGYAGLLFDEYPAFGTEPGNPPVRTSLALDQPANRLTCALRMIWIIPAYILAYLINIAAFVVGFISWFAIIFTGHHPRGMWDFMLKAQRYGLQLYAYMFLLTDTYPSWGSGEGPGVGSPPPPPSSFAAPPPPPPPA